MTISEAIEDIDVPDEAEQIDEEKIINEEYKIWKKNAPFLYDLVVTHALVWPTLTIQWFPDVENVPNRDYNIQRILAGTHTSDEEQNYLQILSVQMPNEDTAIDARKYDQEKDEYGGYGLNECRITTTHRIVHEGEVNRARYMPQNPCLIATKAVSGAVYLFDYTKHPSNPPKDGQFNPDLKLVGHTLEGYGLAWSPLTKGYLASASQDKTVCVWDVNAITKEQKTLDPLAILNAHEGTVEDVSWHAFNSNMLASAGDDKVVMLWDLRCENGSLLGKDKPSQIVSGHLKEVNCVSFSPANEHFFLTGSADRTIGLWDMRNLSERVHSFESHTDEILQIQWSPHEETVFASASADRRINIWDASRVGEEQDAEDAEDGPPELLFVHGGHTSRISDLSWNTNAPWVICSAAEDNIMQIWQMTSDIFADVDEEAVKDEDVE